MTDQVAQVTIEEFTALPPVILTSVPTEYDALQESEQWPGLWS